MATIRVHVVQMSQWAREAALTLGHWRVYLADRLLLFVTICLWILLVTVMVVIILLHCVLGIAAILQFLLELLCDRLRLHLL